MNTIGRGAYTLAVAANDATVQLESGFVRAVNNPAPDGVSVIDLTSYRPRIIAEVDVPTSVAGPANAIAVA